MKSTSIFTTFVSLVFMFSNVSQTLADEVKMPNAGNAAPLIQGKDQNDHTWKLSEALSKKNVLLYFYPKDFTGGCTKEACGFRDRLADLASANVEVVGVSFDTAASHTEFIKKYNLGFTLLADTDGKIAEAYGVRMTGKDMARRVSFLISKNGKVVHVTDSGNADVHLSEMKEAAEKLDKK